MRAFAILNLEAANDAAVRAAIKAERDCGHALHVRVVWEADDLFRALAEATGAGAERLLMAGGDGSLNAAAQHLVDSGADCAICPLPFGTANDFATAAGVYPEMDRAFEYALSGPATPIDYGLAGDRVFVNVATAAIGASATAEADKSSKAVLGGLAYWFSGLKKSITAEGVEAEVEADGWRWQGRLLGLTVANSTMAGGGFRVGHAARLDDGLLDLLIVPELDVGGRSRLALEALQDDWAITSDLVEYRQVAAVRVRFAERTALNLDGEPNMVDAVDFTLRPRGLKVVAPDLAIERPAADDV